MSKSTFEVKKKFCQLVKKLSWGRKKNFNLRSKYAFEVKKIYIYNKKLESYFDVKIKLWLKVKKHFRNQKKKISRN